MRKTIILLILALMGACLCNPATIINRTMPTAVPVLDTPTPLLPSFTPPPPTETLLPTHTASATADPKELSVYNLEIVDLEPSGGDLQTQLKNAAGIAAQMGLRPFVEFTALW